MIWKEYSFISIKLKQKEIEALNRRQAQIEKEEQDQQEAQKEAAIKAIKAGDTKYTAVDGTIPLKEAIIKKYIPNKKLIGNGKYIIIY